MGVPGFYSWLTRRYPMIKHMISKQSLPQIDYLYLDMNGIIYKCVRDDSIIFKAQLMPKELEEIWIQIFNYINQLVNMIKPTKMILMALDGVAPRCKMNNQRARRFRSAQEYKEFIAKFYGYTDIADSQENFKNNSISPGTRFMEQLNQMLHFFIQKKIDEDDYWKNVSIIFTGSDTPGEGEHKIMEFVRANQSNFLPDDTHCFYGADADLIMLGLTLPIKNSCIIRQQYVHGSQKVNIMSSRKEKQINFELIFLSILKECFDLEYKQLSGKMKIQYNIQSITRDFVFLFFFIGNDFLPRIYAYNIREKSIERLIEGFKSYLTLTEAYIADAQLNLKSLLTLLSQVGKFEKDFFADKHNQMQKLLAREKRGFEDEMQNLFLAKLQREQQTLLGLKQMYTNMDISGKTAYYSNYFSIDPSQNVEALWNILAYYVYGLKFVYQYYFQNLASWSWYYPYYFAPLLTDIQFYLLNVLQSKQQLVPFEQGSPFQPFKQLLCILPKESTELLPENFRKYLLDANSVLRNPVDFYPDTVQSVTYGSTRGFQAISMIPFLDQSVICRVYDQQIQNIPQKDLNRNIRRDSRLYEYSIQQKQIEVISPFGSIANFYSKIHIKDVNLLHNIDWISKKNKAPINFGEEKLLKMPSLFMRPFDFKSFKRDGEIKFTVQLQNQHKRQDFKLGQTVYYGYPLQHSGRIQAILTKKKLDCIDQQAFIVDNYQKLIQDSNYKSAHSIRQSTVLFFDYLKTNLPRRNHCKQEFYSFLDLSNTQVFLFLVDTRTFTRNIQGDFKHQFNDNFLKSYSIVPSCITSKNKVYQNTQTNISFRSIQEEFEIGQDVLLIHPDKKICGAKGKVTGYTNDLRHVKVQILQQPKYSDSKMHEVIKLLSTKADIFFSLRFAAEILRTKFDQLQTILGSINVIPPRNSQLPPSIDIGLNFISRRQFKIVPNLVRVNFMHDSDDKKKNNPLKYMELSFRALQIILQYKKKFPEVFSFMEERHHTLVNQARQNDKKIDWDYPIKAEDIYPNEPAKSLMRVYKWLVEKQQTHMPVSSVYSKQVQQFRIQRLKKQFINQKMTREKPSKYKKKKYAQAPIQIVDPNFLFSQRLSQIGSIYLKRKPSNHQIGDIVICITPQFFGHYGAIIGIDDNKYQVLFDQPSFGKGDLGGLCDNLWGYKFQFKEILNLATWPELFSQRIRNAAPHEKQGWIDHIDIYYPMYKTKPFSDFEDVTVFISKEENRKFFTEQFLAYLQEVRTNLKQVQIDESYSVVDNKKEDYKYKYNKKIAYIEKSQVEQASQVMQALSKESPVTLLPIEEPLDQRLVAKPVEKEIIQSKVQEGQHCEIGEEQDATDILG